MCVVCVRVYGHGSEIMWEGIGVQVFYVMWAGSLAEWVCAWRCKHFRLCVWGSVRPDCLWGLFRHRGGEVTGVRRVEGVRAAPRLLVYGVKREFRGLTSRAFGAVSFNISSSNRLW